MKGFDCSTRLTRAQADAFKAQGYDFVMRYLVPTTYAKAITKQEATDILVAGLGIGLVFETTANRALGGRQAGLEDGAVALQCAKDLGLPTTCVIYFAVDFDAEIGQQMSTVNDYIRGCNDATPSYPTGVYGSANVCSAVRNAGNASHSWQTYAWSAGIKTSCNVYQYKNGEYANGVSIDLDESYGNEGFWKPSTPVSMSVADADKIIALLGAIFMFAGGTDEVHRLADVLRKASGREVQG